MKEEIIKKLNNERKALEIPKEKFLKMIKYALEYKKTNPELNEEELINLIRVTMYSYDYALKLDEHDKKDINGVIGAYVNRKSVGECFIVALNALGHINQYENNNSRVVR